LCVPRHRRFRSQRLPDGAAEVLRGQPPLRRGRGAQVAGRRRGGAESEGCRGDRHLWDRSGATAALDHVTQLTLWRGTRCRVPFCNRTHPWGTTMGETRQVLVPDIGDFKDVPIIEIQVKPGDRIAVEAPLITLESDKASMEVPSPSAGVVKAIAVQLGDRVSQGVPILTLELDGSGGAAQAAKPAVTAPPAPTSAPAGVAEVRVPDIGDFKDVPIIEVMVKAGDTIQPEQPLVTLESDKASMEVPSPLGGVVQDLKAKVGDRVSEGSVILTLLTDAAAAQAQSAAAAPTMAAPAKPAAPAAAAPA